jgi:hypothetical protein
MFVVKQENVRARSRGRGWLSSMKHSNRALWINTELDLRRVWIEGILGIVLFPQDFVEFGCDDYDW